MKYARRILCLILTAVFVLGCVPAGAAGYVDERFTDKSWEEVIDDFFTQHNIDPARVSLGYYNTVSG